MCPNHLTSIWPLICCPFWILQVEDESVVLLALPCGRDHQDVLSQTSCLKTNFISYLQQKQAAGIINVAQPGSTEVSLYKLFGKTAQWCVWVCIQQGFSVKFLAYHLFVYIKASNCLTGLFILANCSSFGGTVPLFEAKKRMILSCVPVFAAIFV